MACRLTLSFAEGPIIFCARQQARFAERAGQKIVLQRQLSDLGMQRLHVDQRRQISLRDIAKHTCRAFKQLVTPLLDLVRLSVFACKHLPVTDGRQSPAPARSEFVHP